MLASGLEYLCRDVCETLNVCVCVLVEEVSLNKALFVSMSTVRQFFTPH